MRKYPITWFVIVISLVVPMDAPQSRALVQSNGYSLRFYGNGVNDIDRVKIPLEDPRNAVDVGKDFTVEFFVRANPNENSSGACTTGDSGWINGNTIIDRDVFGPGDYGDYGISLFGQGGVMAFGVSRQSSGVTICGATSVVDGEWHHIAATRNNTTGLLRLFVDGVVDGSTTGPTGDISYRDGRPTQWANDPFLVLGAEKHDYNQDFRSFSGWLDEVRISNTVRYGTDFTPSAEPFISDANTVGLYHFDEGQGNNVNDSSGTNSHGTRRFGGTPAGPEWSEESPILQVAPPGIQHTPSSPSAAPQRNYYATSTPTLTWSRISWAAGYQLQVDNNANFSSPEYDDSTIPATDLGELLPGLSNGTYFWRVRAKRSDGRWGSWSRPESFVVSTT